MIKIIAHIGKELSVLSESGVGSGVGSGLGSGFGYGSTSSALKM